MCRLRVQNKLGSVLFPTKARLDTHPVEVCFDRLFDANCLDTARLQSHTWVQ